MVVFFDLEVAAEDNDIHTGDLILVQHQYNNYITIPHMRVGPSMWDPPSCEGLLYSCCIGVVNLTFSTVLNLLVTRLLSQPLCMTWMILRLPRLLCIYATTVTTPSMHDTAAMTAVVKGWTPTRQNLAWRYSKSLKPHQCSISVRTNVCYQRKLL
jgi:hypothetical protein